MKIRTGFVSNSSSSSFVVIIDSAAYKKALEGADKYTKAILKALKPEKITIGGKELTIFLTYMGQGGEGTFDALDLDIEAPKRPRKKDETDEEYEDAEEVYSDEAFDEFIDAIPADKVHQQSSYN